MTGPADVDDAGGPGSPPTSSALTVLVVDDEPDQMGLLTAYFHRAGCTVIALADGERALALPADMSFDLIVLDLMLPGIDGWALARRLRDRHPDCPIAIASVLDVQDFPAADMVLPKPVSKARIMRLVDEVRQGVGTR